MRRAVSDDSKVWPRAAAAALFAMFVICPIGLAISAVVIGYASEVERISELRTEAVVYRRIVSQVTGFQARLRAISDEIAASRAFYAGATPAAAAAELSQTVKDLMQQAGGELRSVTIAPPKRMAGLDRLVVSVDAALSSAALSKFLRLLQAQRPVLAIDALDIGTRSMTGTEGQLWLTMQVSGFRRPGSERS